jgi:hypothetical protein
MFCESPLGITWGLGRAGGWQGPPEGPIARARQPFRAPHALRNPGPGDHRRGGRGVRRPDMFCESPLGITWGGLVGGRGHRKGQLRVLGSPSALHTKEPRTGGAAGSPRTRHFFCESPLIHTWGY